MAVLVGLVASECEKGDYYSEKLCIQTCELPRAYRDRFTEGRCKISSTFKTKYGGVTVFHLCWRCFIENV